MRESFEKNRMPEAKIPEEQVKQAKNEEIGLLRTLEKKERYVFKYTPKGQFIEAAREKIAKGEGFHLTHSKKNLPELEKLGIVETGKVGKQAIIKAINQKNIEKNIEKFFEENTGGKILKFIENNPGLTTAQISKEINLSTPPVNRIIKNLLSAELIIEEEMPFVGLGNKVLFTPDFVKKTKSEERIKLFKEKKSQNKKEK